MKSGGDFHQQKICAFSVAPCVGCLSPSPISLPVNLVGSGNKEEEKKDEEKEEEEEEEKRDDEEKEKSKDKVTDQDLRRRRRRTYMVCLQVILMSGQC